MYDFRSVVNVILMDCDQIITDLTLLRGDTLLFYTLLFYIEYTNKGQLLFIFIPMGFYFSVFSHSY